MIRRLSLAVAAVAVTAAIAAPSAQAAPAPGSIPFPSFCNGGIGTTSLSGLTALKGKICLVIAHQNCVRLLTAQGVPVVLANIQCLNLTTVPTLPTE
jgi:hypothetical protein